LQRHASAVSQTRAGCDDTVDELPSISYSSPIDAVERFHALLVRARDQRQPLIDRPDIQAFRAFSGTADGLDGVFVDVYGSGAVLIYYEGRTPRDFDPDMAAAAALEVLKPSGVEAVYLKPFAKDRSRLGGKLPDCVTAAEPAVGQPLPEAILVSEAEWNLEIRLYDGLSTGLFIDQRESRIWVSNWVARRTVSMGLTPSILNTFAYTCAFSVAAARGGGLTTSVDVSSRYLDWGKRNFAHNAIDVNRHRFARMDTFEFFRYARRKELRYDLIILDPPSFASGSRKKKISPWSSIEDYARLTSEAAALLNRNGVIFASTNTQELCRPGRLEREIVRGLKREPNWIDLPQVPIDFMGEQDRFAARAFGI
jgi:23S rRNA (cytosine1962-C5)-methyltransferase